MNDDHTTMTQTPFEAVEGTWTKKTARLWEHRTYHRLTLSALLHTLYTATRQSKLTSALISAPGSVRRDADWWPIDNHGDTIAFTQARDAWESVDGDSREPPPDEVIATWVGEGGCFILLARRESAPGRKQLFTLENWQLSLSWDCEAAAAGVNAVTGCYPRDHSHKELFRSLASELGRRRCEPSEAVVAHIRSALSLADRIDPVTRANAEEKLWTDLVNTVQLEVAWQLYSDRLLPAIARALDATIGYEFVDIHVFNRLGSRYEEFLSWHDNRTGYGKDLDLFLDREVVKTLLESEKPRLVRMRKEDGVLNPHLAELAGLREGLLIPLVHGNSVQGMAALYFTEESELEETDLERIRRFGEIIARSLENSNAHEDMRLMASVDALTGLNNRRSFNDVIEKETHRSSRYRLPLSLILIDIDYFKKYNDSNGHLKGDYLLHDFASILKSMVREEDTVARYGGEEFAIIFPHTPASAANVAAEKIRRRVAEHEFSGMDSQPGKRLTISLGVADSDGSIEDYHELIDQADKALYRAKESGRNRAVLYSPDLASQSA